MKKQLFILALVVAVMILAVVFLSRSTDTDSPENISAIPEGDPMDVAIEFYNDWLRAEQSTSTDPFAEGLATDSRLSESLQGYIAEADMGATVHPILCQTTIPERVGAKTSYVQDREAQLLILARGLPEKSSRQAVVDLVAQNGQWVINAITCTEGESAPEREFSFEREGFLLKSVPPPLNPDYWHLVFEENNTPGHTAPLFFAEDSICVAVDGAESVCDPDAFTEASAAIVKGQMTEAGVDVKRIELLQTE